MTYGKDNKVSNYRDTTAATHEGKLGDHPVGGAVGAAVGAAAAAAAAGAIHGAALGTVVGGPLGTAAGIAIGGVAGALAGKGIAQAVNPTSEDAYWQNNYKTRDYVDANASYDDYSDAYRFGYDNYGRYQGRHFDEIEPELRQNWGSARGKSNLDWDRARPATRDAYDRLYNADKNGGSL